MPRAKKTEVAAAVADPVVEKKSAVRCTTAVSIEMNQVNVTVADIQNAVKKAVKNAGLAPAKLNIYVNTAEQVAYYTVDGEGNDAYQIDLTTL
jgi:hypothetical protein